MKSKFEIAGIKIKLQGKKNGKCSFSVKSKKGKFGIDWSE